MEIKQLRCLLGLMNLCNSGFTVPSRVFRKTQDFTTLFNAKGQPITPLEGEVNWSLVDADLDWAAAAPNQIILTLDHSQYPSRLKEISSPPLVLFAKGDLSFLQKPQIAIVGSRNPTRDGKALAFEFAKTFSNLDITISSGLALGIDAAAHQGALQGSGGTVAVLGNGLNKIYPKSHQALSEEIASHGVLLSEFPLYVDPKSTHFPRRNRIISGLSLGTLVVEAAMNSGSLITAKTALNQGREVFAIPGSIHSPLAKGCHHLIQQGAKLVQTAQDVLEELEAEPMLKRILLESRKASKLNSCIDKQDRLDISLKEGLAELLDKVSYGPTSMDDLVDASGLSVSVVSSMLLELELMGAVAQVPGGYSRTRLR
jgi:DNA processing protein